MGLSLRPVDPEVREGSGVGGQLPVSDVTSVGLLIALPPTLAPRRRPGAASDHRSVEPDGGVLPAESEAVLGWSRSVGPERARARQVVSQMWQAQFWERVMALSTFEAEAYEKPPRLS